ncbi:DNA modification methylase [Sphingomonas sp. TZW2008]|uniref:DNA modification methylase n=1 Tax=Sphingomonas sp. TZW2008 TaxID=1917973 RepID=UPI0015C5078E|nr:DNA modification methylase [Sphingomonas sp. TZW2008]
MTNVETATPAKRGGKRQSGMLGDTLKEAVAHTSRARAAREKRVGAHERRAETVIRRNDLVPELVIVMRSVTELIAPTRRTRKYDAGDVMEMGNHLSAFGFVQPIVIGRDGRTIVDGELRLEGARWLGLEQVPCILLANHSRSEERALRLALNRLGQRRSWDMDALRVEIEELLIEEQPIELLGFDAVELDQIMVEEQADDEETVDIAEGPAVTRAGDLWILGDHRLLCGDAREATNYDVLMPGEQAQLILTDPPYNIAVSDIVSTQHAEFAFASGEMSDDEFAAFLTGFISAALPVLVKGAVVFAFMDWRQIELLLRAGRGTGLELLNIITWVKANAGRGSLYRSQHELVAMFKTHGEHKNRIQLGKRGRNRSNVWFAPGAGTAGSDARAFLKEHPTSKPVQLLVDAMLDVTDPGDIVIDAFGGSGSTLIAAERTKRRARVIEYEPRYCDLIVRRWEAANGGTALLAATSSSFADTAREREPVPGKR